MFRFSDRWSNSVKNGVSYDYNAIGCERSGVKLFHFTWCLGRRQDEIYLEIVFHRLRKESEREREKKEKGSDCDLLQVATKLLHLSMLHKTDGNRTLAEKFSTRCYDGTNAQLVYLSSCSFCYAFVTEYEGHTCLRGLIAVNVI